MGRAVRNFLVAVNCSPSLICSQWVNWLQLSVSVLIQGAPLMECRKYRWACISDNPNNRKYVKYSFIIQPYQVVQEVCDGPGHGNWHKRNGQENHMKSQDTKNISQPHSTRIQPGCIRIGITVSSSYHCYGFCALFSQKKQDYTLSLIKILKQK